VKLFTFYNSNHSAHKDRERERDNDWMKILRKPKEKSNWTTEMIQFHWVSQIVHWKDFNNLRTDETRKRVELKASGRLILF